VCVQASVSVYEEALLYRCEAVGNHEPDGMGSHAGGQ
jgi:hypothetical protein